MPDAQKVLTKEDVFVALSRHIVGDWGDIGVAAWKRNDRSLQLGQRVVSVYHAGNGNEFWVITDRERSLTTILVPTKS